MENERYENLETPKKGINRRHFLQGAGVLAAGAVATGVGLGGCSPQDADDNAQSATDWSQEGLTSTTVDQKWAFEIAPDPIQENEIVETVEADIIVIGAGVAGLVCATSAAENGADVTLISASATPLARGGTVHAFKSRVLDNLGLGDSYEGIIGDYFKKEMIAASWDLDQRIWYKYYNNSEEAMNWLLDKMEAADYECIIENFIPSSTAGVNTTIVGGHSFMGGEVVTPGMGGPLVVEVLEKDALAAGVEFSYKTIAKQLVRENDNTGRVSAIIAQMEDGSYKKYVGTKAIVLATGDFSGDREMVAKYCPEVLPLLAEKETDAAPNYDALFEFGGLMPGDGHKMGLWVGAAWQKVSACAPMVFTGGPTATATPVDGLLMDASGSRIGNEDLANTYLARQLRRVPGEALYGVWGSNAAIPDKWVVAGPYGSGALSPEDVLSAWDKAVEGSQIVKGSTIEEVISQLELPSDATLATVKRYTELAKEGADLDFYKRPELFLPIEEGPFYGMKYEGQDLLTIMGGLHTNANMQVCDDEDAPIEGLYNLGTMVGDVYGNLYTLLTPGFNLGGMCLTFGYLTGRALARGEL